MTFNILIANEGTREEEVTIKINNKEFAVQETKKVVLEAIDESGSEETVAFPIRIPDYALPAGYTFTVSLDLRGDFSDEESIRLTVSECARFETPTPTPTAASTPKPTPTPTKTPDIATEEENNPPAQAGTGGSGASTLQEQPQKKPSLITGFFTAGPTKTKPVSGLIVLYAAMLGVLGLFYYTMRGRL